MNRVQTQPMVTLFGSSAKSEDNYTDFFASPRLRIRRFIRRVYIITDIQGGFD